MTIKVGDKFRIKEWAIGKHFFEDSNSEEVYEVSGTNCHGFHAFVLKSGRTQMIIPSWNAVEWIKDSNFIETTTRLKTGRFGNLHITDHNNLLKVSVVAMTNAEEVRTVIEQLTKVAEFLEGEE